ncbi:sugar O-acetyltransferase [Enterovibrio sp. ZSDZ42]|uniref:Sugar O-acetyltransferase n=1 Tax=Enterovibrio gelatinilyticus TaxID=2899819 RepID=A0ABT5R7H8_9GAMM|nr:sugar O-acetyltransferase [Enterovibrio sp. ZSDZ42]MDD1796224.1 sugar O-acetyltransferase [Enterovibrio sp. ZSDZ42]
MTEFEKMSQGYAFNGIDDEISTIRANAFHLLKTLNEQRSDSIEDIGNALFGSFDPESMVMAPFQCEFGKNIHIGHQTFLNMGVVMLDGAPITIGSNVLIGPNCQFYTASHPLDYRRRRQWETYCKPIVVENDVWIGGSTVICQGVTIGARSVIAANSVVTRDVPPDSLVGGSPAKVIRMIHENETEEETGLA